mmetsp:Transcript_28804/g.43503  ORF Transcript_28804/g.43503 Transcript_28804/m.43503 type:complete len:129 (-) Transcript_28804:413-799(-)|eukprot:CAMPEP_0178914828 /NCGR_PEP_ID=MMETSP0786-20121207/11658_1 /TAXON_ID=186022 /ORGANISM="Thalassionema frauenfeldii, Strain CCMP 1798" /LENGTH=128 /DNA_ID=CAMNT_0020587811 /DNA_START=149 /DNA_END=535 /DNA_ORIENTATION=-
MKSTFATILLFLAYNSDAFYASRESNSRALLTQHFSSPEDPCWQDVYDDDCSMSTVFSAGFVASKWIKSMPCGQGLRDCDTPEPLTAPNVKSDGIGEVDVMDFLGLKRATAINVGGSSSTSKGSDVGP